MREGALLLRLDGAIVEEPELVDPLERLLASEALSAEYSSYSGWQKNVAVRVEGGASCAI